MLVSAGPREMAVDEIDHSNHFHLPRLTEKRAARRQKQDNKPESTCVPAL